MSEELWGWLIVISIVATCIGTVAYGIHEVGTDDAADVFTVALGAILAAMIFPMVWLGLLVTGIVRLTSRGLDAWWER